MAEFSGAGMETGLSEEFRGRQHSFHTVSSFHKKKRPAAVPLDFAQPQRPRLDEVNISVSAPLPTSPFVRVLGDFVATTDKSITRGPYGSTSDTPVDDNTEGIAFSAVPDLIDASSPVVETPPESPEEDEEEVEMPQRIIRPEDISLHNPDSGLGYRASRTEYFTDDEDDGHEDEDEEESEQEEGEVTEPDDFPSSHPEYPDDEHDMFMPRSHSPSMGEVIEEEILEEEEVEETLPYTTPLDLNVSFDPTVHMGLLMIDPSHQDRFNELYAPASYEPPQSGFTAYDTLLQQYEAANALRLEQLEQALMLNTDLDEEVIEEVVEVIEEEDYPPANPPSSPAFLHSEV